MLDRYEKSLAGLAEQGGAVQAQLVESMQASTQSLGDHFAALREGLASLSTVLEKFGDQHSAVEARDSAEKEEPASGWGLFRKKNGEV